MIRRRHSLGDIRAFVKGLLYQDDPKDQGSPIQPNEIKPDTEDLSHKEIRCRMLEMAKASFPNGIPSRCLII
jgi:hypothetical protein